MALALPGHATVNRSQFAQFPTQRTSKPARKTSGRRAPQCVTASYRESGRDDHLEQTEGSLWVPKQELWVSKQELSVSRRKLLGGSAALTAAGAAAPMIAPQVPSAVCRSRLHPEVVREAKAFVQLPQRLHNRYILVRPVTETV
eukprot:396959-Prorocentrum_minimum.AAC.1